MGLGRIFAIDFDGTLHKAPSSMFPYTDNKYANLPLIEMLLDNKKNNPLDQYILWTCRQSREEIKLAVDFCKQYGLRFDAVNENVYRSYGYTRKIIADIYIDDRAVNVNNLDEIRAVL